MAWIYAFRAEVALLNSHDRSFGKSGGFTFSHGLARRWKPVFGLRVELVRMEDAGERWDMKLA